MPTTLLAVTGLSPAVVTESVWALTRRRPRIVPDRVRFITTTTGAQNIEERLFTPRADWKGRTVWDALRTAVGAGRGELVTDDPCVISSPDEAIGRMVPLEDIVTPDHNDQAATIIFDEVSRITRDKDQHLVATRWCRTTSCHEAMRCCWSPTPRAHEVLLEPNTSWPLERIYKLIYIRCIV